MTGILKNYFLYYRWEFNLVNQHHKDFKYYGIGTYGHFLIKASIYSADKTRIPAFIFAFILFGYGFDFCTHARN